ncbi:Sugar transport protein [Thalictrum thalictroides]|uniref:Sugar transport protein n=1 Tax=Thalictrum thalictroides TaxID=46969 RepID=A0A7J6WKE4_THATH|nr:Sugar transport protein [Thalictrum thalictroides]
MDNGQGWRWSLGLAAVPGLSILLGGIFLPETPNSLIERNLPEEAKKMLKRIRGVDNVDEEYNDLVAASEASKKVTDPWHRLLFDRKYRPQLTYSIALPSLQQVTGINVVMFYAPVLFKTLGFQADASLMSALITGGVNVLATFIALWLADKKGRKTLFIAGGIQMVISQV